MSGEGAVDQLVNRIRQAKGRYHQLVLLASPGGSGKTAALHRAAERTGGHLLNLNLETSRRLLDLDLTEHQRALRLPRVLEDILGRDMSPVVLDHIELIFDPAFQQDPLGLLKALSRHRTVVAAWSGMVDDGYLTYAVPGHREFRRYAKGGLTVVTMEESG